jgi:hypothetical protein
VITLLLPWAFGAAIVGALVVIGLHLLSVRRPPELLLPTTRFLPDRAVRAVSRTKRPSDLLLLLLRVAALLAVGLAAAQPTWRPRARTRATLVVVDRGVVADTNAIRALVRAPSDVVPDAALAYTFAPDSIDAADDPGALMAMAWRSAAQLARRDPALDSVDLHVLFSRALRAGDDGWTAWRDAWPGRVITHEAVAIPDDRRVELVTLDDRPARAGDDDPVRSAFVWHVSRRAMRSGGTSGHVDTIGIARDQERQLSGNASVVRERNAPGRNLGVRVYWPANGIPEGWRALAREDTVSAVVASGHAILSSFVVRAQPDSSESAIAWWSDGRVAATETRTIAGCDRHVAVADVADGELLLGSSANALFDRLLAPCASRTPVAVSALTVRRSHGTAMADAEVFRRHDAQLAGSGAATWVTPVLLSVGLLLLLVESRVRARPMGMAA